jgi:hypothetical protein
MMVRVVSPALLPVALLAVTLTAQARPDFSGKWIDARTVDGKQVIEETLVVTQDAKGLSYISYSGNGREGERLAVAFDGTPRSQARQMAGEATSTAAWEGEVLSVATTIKRPGRPDFAYQRRWSIDSAKQLVIETTRKVQGQAPTTTKTVYRRPQ